MKTVFSNTQCTHVWAQQSQPHGRGPSIHFDGATLFSYQTPIARFVIANGSRVALYTTEKYSMTTAKHMHYARRAWSGPSYTVPDLFPDGDFRTTRGMSRFPRHNEPDHSGNVQYFLHKFEIARAALMRVPCESYRVKERDDESGSTNAHAALREIAQEFERYSYIFRLGLAAPNWCAAADEIIARRDKLLNDPKAKAKREAREAVKAAERVRKEAERAERDRIARLEAAEQIKLWRAGADVRLPYGAERDEHGSAMLRLSADGETVQTSMGADAPANDVRNVLRVVYAQVMRRGETWQRDTRYTDDRQETYSRLGHFRLNSIDAEGNVRAGCHFISAAEVTSIAAALGVVL